MFKSITMAEQLQKTETANRALRSALDQTTANTAYIAMMSDVELPATDTAPQNGVTEGSDEDE